MSAEEEVEAPIVRSEMADAGLIRQRHAFYTMTVLKFTVKLTVKRTGKLTLKPTV